MGALGAGLGLALRQSARTKPGFVFAGPELPPGASLTRASGATRIDAFGTVIPVAANVARFEAAGLLIEAAASNLVADSTLSGANWTLNGGAVRTTGLAAPDGGSDAVGLALAGGGSVHRFVSGLAPGGNHVASIWARSAGATHVRITTNNSVAWSTGVSARFALGAAWRRFAVAGVLSDGANCNLVIGAATADAGLDETCLGDVELWGAQIEAGSVATSLIQTSGGGASRAADALTLDWGAKGLADGERSLRLTLDDGSHEDVTVTVAGGLASLPVASRPHLRSARAL